MTKNKAPSTHFLVWSTLFFLVTSGSKTSAAESDELDIEMPPTYVSDAKHRDKGGSEASLDEKRCHLAQDGWLVNSPSKADVFQTNVIKVGGQAYYGRDLALNLEPEVVRLYDYLADIGKRDPSYWCARYNSSYPSLEALRTILERALHGRIIFADKEQKKIVAWAEVYPLSNERASVEFAVVVDPHYRRRGLAGYLLQSYLSDMNHLVRCYGRPVKTCHALVGVRSFAANALFEKYRPIAIDRDQSDTIYTYACAVPLANTPSPLLEICQDN